STVSPRLGACIRRDQLVKIAAALVQPVGPPITEQAVTDGRCSSPGRNNAPAGACGAASNRHPLESYPRPQAGSAPCLGAWGARRPIPLRDGRVESAALILQSPPATAGK